MEKPSRIAANLAAAAVVASLFGMSAFADSRHHDETDRNGRTEQSQERVRRAEQPSAQSSRFENRSQQSTENINPQHSQTFDRRQERQGQTWDRNRSGEQTYNQRDRANGSYSQNYDRRGSEAQRGYDNRRDQAPRGYDNRRDQAPRGYEAQRGHDHDGSYGRYGNYGHDSRHSITMQGRVTRIQHEHDGYRVWLDHGGYSYWVPMARFNLWPLRVGLNIRLGGWWDPMGYVNVYDMGPIGGPYYTSGDLRGVVESVDYRRGTAVVRDDLSGSFVTVLLRGNDPRLGSLRPGDYVDVSGAWSRGGYFEAYNLLGMGDGRGGYGYGGY